MTDAASKALPVLQKSAAEFVAKRACVSCHHNALSILVLHLAQSRGLNIDVKVLEAVEQKTFRELRSANALDDAIQGVNLADPTPNESYLLMAAGAAGLKPDLTTAVYARRMARWQRDGHWVTSDFRPPHSSSLFTAAATAVRAIKTYMPTQLASERDETILRARQWLFATRPVSTEDAAFRLMGLVWSDASTNERASAVRDLLAMQKPAGGWGQLAVYDADAYSTGEALYALHEAGIAADSREWQKGAKFLLSSQAADGTWRVRTRMLSPAEVSPMYFPTGFPYGKDEFLSYAGTCWAVMALISAMPEAPVAAPLPAPAIAGTAPEPWVGTALFGTTRELESLLDKGLDPKAKTSNGTTLLMMAAADPDKVRTLLARGADPAVRAANGVDALTAASSYYGSSATIELLLNAGSPSQPPEGVRLRRHPLVLASMSGDVQVVKALLSHGAEPSAEALSEAVTFGHPEVVRALLAGGADAGIRESTGINLLHWATITNRATVIPLLAASGVPLDDTDDAGYTPLMYAAAIDQGDTASLQALLRAGANRQVKNNEGRTAADLARRFKHAALAEALRPAGPSR